MNISEDKGMCRREYDTEIGETHLHECNLAEDLGNKLCDIQDYFLGMIEMLYGKKEFDRNRLENYIGEICHYLDIKEPIEPLAIISNGLRTQYVK
jgi:hypothetical protein